MERNLLKYIWQHSRRDQLWMLVIILASMPTYFLSLELPKRIVNNPIQGVGFEQPGATEFFLQTYLPFGETLFGKPVMLFQGIELERLGYLWALSIAFMILVIANGLFKLYINTYKGRMGERILRRLRYELFDRVLRYPLSRFRRTRSSEIASMIKDEVEPMGEFIGDAFTQPLFLGGQALVALLFIFLQNVYLGIVTMIIIAFQAWIVPILRRRLIELGRERQIAARHFAGRLGEVVEGIQDAHTNDTTNRERAEMSGILGRLFFIRFELFQRKFSVKFINNLLIQFLAFFFYAVGGDFAIRGTLDIGQLIGVIVAYKDLPAPVRGLIAHDQKRLTVEVRYAQIIEQFTEDNLQSTSLHQVPEGEVPRITKGFEISRLQVQDDTGSKLIENATATIRQNEKVAVVGAVGSGTRTFVEVLGRVQPVTGGKLTLDDVPLDEQPEYVTGRRISYLDGNSYFPQGSVLDTLTYVIKNQPVGEMISEITLAGDDSPPALRRSESRKSANFNMEFHDNWTDYKRAGVEGPAELKEKLREILLDVGLEEDIRGLGLRGTLDPKEFPELADAILEARAIFRNRLDDLGFNEFVEPFDPEKYNTQSTIAENLLFGTAKTAGFESASLPTNSVVRKILEETELFETLFDMGKQVAVETLDLFGDLDPSNAFFDELTYMSPDDLPVYRELLANIGEKDISDIQEDKLIPIMSLAFSYIEERNRLGLLTHELKLKLLVARKALREKLTALPVNPVEFYEPGQYNHAASLQDNVLLGRVSSAVAEGEERVSAAIRELLDELELTDDVFRIGLNYDIGSGGKRLSEPQRQKLHLARALLKRPDILVVNQGLNSLSTREQGDMIKMVLNYTDTKETDHDMGVIWVPMNPHYAKMFDRVLMFEDGELTTDSVYDDLMENSEAFKLLQA